MKRTLPTVLLALSLALTGACNESQSGGASYPDNQQDQVPGSEAEEPADLRDNIEEPDGINLDD